LFLEGSTAWLPTINNSSPQTTKVSRCYSHVEDESKYPTTSVSSEEIPILYESDRLLIIHKPHGIAHHNDPGDNDQPDSYGIVNLLRQQQKQRLWGVHRLDRVTSGILIFAKDADMASQLTGCFANKKVQKFYVGISAKPPKKKKQGLVQGGMSKSRDKSWKLMRGTNEKNYAKTRFFTAPVHINDTKYTCILFRPFTGKTHQLRVAAKSVGLALLGDPTYKDGMTTTEDRDRDRTYLHASGIHIPAFEGQESVSLWCPPPFFLEDNDDDDDDDSSFAALDTVLQKLMTKHCDVPSILQAMDDGRNTNH
jgi:tRNA pseudouridine32 synthase/23S rRNA pseudouridine746 synthase